MKMSPKVAAKTCLRDSLSKTVVRPPNLETFELKGDPRERLAHFFASPKHLQEYLKPYGNHPVKASNASLSPRIPDKVMEKKYVELLLKKDNLLGLSRTSDFFKNDAFTL
jgi:hypothetical protein